MISRIETIAFEGLEIKEIDVQVHMNKGIPSFNIVGLPDKTVAESRERLKAAFSAMGIDIFNQKITVNLSPADLSKEGSHFDLPIALAILASLKKLPLDELYNYLALGEIALDGEIKASNGVFAASIYANAKQKGLIFPKSQLNEVLWLNNKIELLPANNLTEIINFFQGTYTINLENLTTSSPNLPENNISPKIHDLSEVKGQGLAKRALEIAASGGHNLLMIGPPGTGKSMLAAAINSILPPLSNKESLEISLIYSIAGKLKNSSLVKIRPFRSPHHSTSMQALIGGGKKALPGEITLAHRGILFLDELAEFPKNVLDSLRQPLENGSVQIARVNQHVEYPAKFQLIAAMNPCRCGYFTSPSQQCSKAPYCSEQYQAKISGPLLDRMDITVEVPTLHVTELYDTIPSEDSLRIQARVIKARNLQTLRYTPYNISTNAEATGDMLEKTCNLSQKAQNLLIEAMEKMKLSARSHYRLIKVARTIADLENAEEIHYIHMAEALSYRRINYVQKLKQRIAY